MRKPKVESVNSELYHYVKFGEPNGDAWAEGTHRW